MKKVLLLAVMAVLVTGCSNEHKCKSLIKDYLSKNLDDYSSYESVEFSELIPDSSSFNNDSTFKALGLKQKSYAHAAGMISDEELFKSGAEVIVDTNCIGGIHNVDFSDSSLYYMRKQVDLVRSFKPKHIGWKMYNKYRTKVNGNIKLINSTFHFDMNLEKIILADFEK